MLYHLTRGNILPLSRIFMWYIDTMEPAHAHFQLTDFVQTGEAYHFARVEVTEGNQARYHNHDYHEIFWVTHGAGQHRWNGRTDAVEPHQLFLINPQDRHGVGSQGTDALGIINVAFPSAAWSAIQVRYFEDGFDPFLASPSARRIALDPSGRSTLNFWARRLDRPGRPGVALDGFLMDLPRLIQPLEPAATRSPDWLERACRDIVQPENFRRGTPAFARLSGRTPSHLARATRRWLGRTPSDIVNAARMEFSAHQLITTNRPIVEIALNCGLTNLSHFYALFRHAHGLSPRRYRLRATSLVSG